MVRKPVIRVGRDRTGIEPARSRQPAQHDREDEEQTKARPEHRQRRAEQREKPRAMVDQGVAEIGGQDAKHDPVLVPNSIAAMTSSSVAGRAVEDVR